jgi:hypothetical protein
VHQRTGLRRARHDRLGKRDKLQQFRPTARVAPAFVQQAVERRELTGLGLSGCDPRIPQPGDCNIRAVGDQTAAACPAGMTSVEVAALSARFGIRFSWPADTSTGLAGLSVAALLSGPLTVTSSAHTGDEIRRFAWVLLDQALRGYRIP